MSRIQCGIRRCCRSLVALASLWLITVAPPALEGAQRGPERPPADDPDAAAEGPVNVLEAIEVSTYADNLPWVYVETGGTEILSMCSDAATRAFLNIMRGRNALLNDTLPAHLRGDLAAPGLVVLFDADDSEALQSGQLRRQYMLTETGAELSRRKPPETPQTVWVEDQDLAAFSANLRYGPPHDVTLSRRWPYSVTTALRFVLARQYPQLPPWLLAGLDGHLRESTWIERERSFELAALPWVSPAATRAMRQDGRPAATLLPLMELFRTDPAEHTRAVHDTYSLFEVQSALFVRWALESEWRGHRAAFWQFVTRAADEPVTEELFVEHFGMSIAAAEHALLAYLPQAVRADVTIRLPRRWNSERFTMRSATEGEIGRLQGEWERLQVRASGRTDPADIADALHHARKVARRGYELGRADARILALRGMIEVDAGDKEAARPFLEEAVRNGVERPVVYVALARLRLQHALENPGSRFGSISGGQLEGVLQALDAARTKVPLLSDVYLLTAEACASSAALPELHYLRMLAEGARLFPRNSELVYRAAELHAANGMRHDAINMVAHSLSLSPDPVARDRLQGLQASLSDPVQFRLRTSATTP